MTVIADTEQSTAIPPIALKARDVGPADPEVRKARYLDMYREGGEQLEKREEDAVFTLLSGYDARVAAVLQADFLVEHRPGIFDVKPGADAVEAWLNEVRVSTRDAHEGDLVSDGTLRNLLNQLNVTSALYRIEQLTKKGE